MIANSSTKQDLQNSGPAEDGRRRIFYAAAWLFLFWSATGFAVETTNAETKFFNIPQQRADLSLTQFAEQADLTLIFKFKSAKDKTANKLEGEYSVVEAIGILLADTGLEPVFSDQGLLMSVSDEKSEPEGDQMNVKKKAGLAALFAAVFASPTAVAQVQQDEVLEEIIVTGSIRGSLSRALDIKRNNKEFVDGLVAEDFAKFPDNNLGEALQRIPGIVVDRNDGGSQSNAIGEGSTINVRGLGADFTRTEINGMTATNPGQQRGFGFNVLASELFQSVIVKKSLSAKDNEGGLAGTVMLNTYRPLSVDERKVIFSPKITYSDLADEASPAGTFIYLDQSDDGRFGAALVLNYTETAPMEHNAGVANWDFLRDSMKGNYDLLTPAEQAAIEDVRIPRDTRVVVNAREQKRFNAALTLEAQVSDTLSVTFDNLYADLDHTGSQTRNDISVEGWPATFVPVDMVTDGNQFISGTFGEATTFARLLDYEYDAQSSLFQSILSATWDATENLTVMPSIGYATAKEDFVWNDFDVRSGASDVFLQFDGEFVTFDPAIGDTADPSIYTVLARIRNRPDIDQDDEFSAKLDFNWSINRGALTSLEFGLRLSDREKDFQDFDGRATLDGSITDVSPYITVHDLDIDGAPSGLTSSYVALDFAALRQAAVPGGFTVNKLDLSSYNITEETLAGYVVLNYDFERFGGNIGVRVVQTDQTSVGYQSVGGVLSPARFTNDYTYALPSLNLKWDISDTVVGRFSAYRSLTRPLLTDIVPGRTLPNFDGGNGTSGNPELDPFTANNFDIGIEWYFAKDAAFTAAVFRKDLNGLIERFVDEVVVIDPSDGQPINVNLSRPVNGQSAEVNGLEVGLQSPFSSSDGPLSNAGFVVNATFTDSKASFRNDEDLRTSRLPGLSEKSYNAILYYDADVFSARLAYNWRSEFLQAVSGSGGNPISREDYGQLDFSSTLNVNDRWSVTFDALNITNEQLKVYTFLDKRFSAGISDTGRKFLISATLRL